MLQSDETADKPPDLELFSVTRRGEGSQTSNLRKPDIQPPAGGKSDAQPWLRLRVRKQDIQRPAGAEVRRPTLAASKSNAAASLASMLHHE